MELKYFRVPQEVSKSVKETAPQKSLRSGEVMNLYHFLIFPDHLFNSIIKSVLLTDFDAPGTN
jgi:hypothetical protein